MSAAELHNFIRGNDKVPGAWAIIDNQVLYLPIDMLCYYAAIHCSISLSVCLLHVRRAITVHFKHMVTIKH